MSKHTKGPWAVTRKFEVGPVSREDDQSNGMVVPVADVFGENREANARLIAAAPDLLVALREATLALDGLAKGEGVFKPIEQTIVLALAAITKAEGRP